MAEYSEQQASNAFGSSVDLIDSLISDVTQQKNQVVKTIEKFEAKIVWLTEVRLRELSKMNASAQRTVTEVPVALIDQTILATQTPDQGAVVRPAIHARMKLADAVRAIVHDFGILGAKTNDVAQALAQIGHPISTAADCSKKVGSALCALKPKANSSSRKKRAGKNDLYRDDETGRFYSPEAWIAREHSSNASPYA